MTDRKHLYSGKVRDIYDGGDGLLLFVASDRLSVFDVVLGETVPDKGRVLTAMSTFWFDELSGVLPNHVVATDVPDIPDEWVGRTTLARKAEMLKIECIVRGYLSGSAWKEYQASGMMNGVPLPPGMQESQQLPQPVFTPSTKADIGDHDVNITYEDSCVIVGKEVAEQAREASLELYRMGAERALLNGIVIADTKFELGFIDGELARVRRDPHPGLVAVLARRRGDARCHAAVVRQAAGARLRRVARVGQDRHPPRRCPTR